MSVNATRDAIARILRDTGVPEPDVIALEILAAVRGHGWRPTNVVPLPPQWQAPAGPPVPAERVHDLAAQLRASITREET